MEQGVTHNPPANPDDNYFARALVAFDEVKALREFLDSITPLMEAVGLAENAAGKRVYTWLSEDCQRRVVGDNIHQVMALCPSLGLLEGLRVLYDKYNRTRPKYRKEYDQGDFSDDQDDDHVTLSHSSVLQVGHESLKNQAKRGARASKKTDKRSHKNANLVVKRSHHKKVSQSSSKAAKSSKKEAKSRKKAKRGKDEVSDIDADESDDPPARGSKKKDKQRKRAKRGKDEVSDEDADESDGRAVHEQGHPLTHCPP